MARTLNSPISDQRGELVYLYEIHHDGGGSPLRLTNSNSDITALTFVWSATGGRLIHGGAPEVTDRRGAGVEITLYGVDQTIVQQIQNNQFRGQVFRIYMLHFDPDTGVQDTPDLIFLGRQNGDYKGKTSRDPESTESGGQLTLSTRISADLAAVNQIVSVRTNVHSHQEMLRRSGVASPTDTAFERVLSIQNQEIRWGDSPPEPPYSGPVDDTEQDTGVEV